MTNIPLSQSNGINGRTVHFSSESMEESRVAREFDAETSGQFPAIPLEFNAGVCQNLSWISGIVLISSPYTSSSRTGRRVIPPRGSSSGDVRIATLRTRAGYPLMCNVTKDRFALIASNQLVEIRSGVSGSPAEIFPTGNVFAGNGLPLAISRR